MKIAAHRPMSHRNPGELGISEDRFDLLFISCCQWKLNKMWRTAKDEVTHGGVYYYKSKLTSIDSVTFVGN
jgi:hypothetical protein